MSWIEGVSQCWWLSDTCVVHWDAWAAIGTVFAALVALGLGAQSQLQQWSTARKRRSVATKLARSHLRKLFDQMEVIANSPGISAAIWDRRVVNFVQSAADMIESACIDTEKCLLDIDEGPSEAVSDVVAESHLIATIIKSWDREPMERRVEIADYSSKDIHGRATAVLAKEGTVMNILGGSSKADRLCLPRTDR